MADIPSSTRSFCLFARLLATVTIAGMKFFADDISPICSWGPYATPRSILWLQPWYLNNSHWSHFIGLQPGSFQTRAGTKLETIYVGSDQAACLCEDIPPPGLA